MRPLLLEYGSCSNAFEAAVLFESRDCLKPYLEKKWLTRAFDGDQPCLRASHYVGVLPFSDTSGKHSILIAPKGCGKDWCLGLRRFLELLALAEDAAPPEDSTGLQGEMGPDTFLLFLARHYAQLLQELCRRDFRSYYRGEEGELRSYIRGRLQLARYARGALRGKPHVLPCQWEEFTVDNWDNRILWAAVRRLERVAACLDIQAAVSVWKPFQPLLSWFSAVKEVAITAGDLRKSRLGRTSRYYRKALTWARLLLQGSDLPAAGGDVPPLVLDANVAFEQFAEVVARAALPDAAWRSHFQQEFTFLTGQQNQNRKPDILLSSSDAFRAVGDTKYKDVLERATDARLGTAKEILETSIQPADWNQLYVYMRMHRASCGFFVLPFWNAEGDPCEWLDDFQFTKSPCDGPVRVAVLALNLLKPLNAVKNDAAKKLRAWLSASEN
jgi:hypothetical protein